MADYSKIFNTNFFDDETAQMVPGTATPDYSAAQWSPCSYDSSPATSCFTDNNYNNNNSTAWDLGSPAGSGSLDDCFVPNGNYVQPQAQTLQAYTYDGQLVKAEPTTLLDCLNAPMNTNSSNNVTPDQAYAAYQAQQHVEEARVKFEETSKMAQQIAYNDVMAACRALRISPDPAEWSIQDTRQWLLWTCQQYRNFGIDVNQLLNSRIDGLTLCLMTEADFKDIPFGDCIMWALEIWKGASEALKMEQRPIIKTSADLYQQQMSSPSDTESYSSIVYGQSFSGSSTTSSQQSYCFDQLSVGSPSSIPDSGLDIDGSEDGDSEGFDMTCGRATGSHTHLWQFLKEMLANPRYKSALHWTDRAQGIFKIDDSTLVAKKWGERKHRPAMNYDKLSRSIRQYYKKGIMKKTTRSQRLVYQFCAHYAN
ncbi:putative DNA-binding protein D-ETS-4 [Hypsibius exemplaris]|uniref:DNA-binding protein D-ETS-4 n=1 Tax=Hypsibius exemplaris TaxID=2072580 RepID=A0A1W0WG66_HYPEX|nr:putative DNA-binding protein D-ETS-4 [Hypsibius exemplaris]